MKALLVCAALCAALATSSVAIAQTPQDGVRHVVQVRDSRGVPVPDGTVLKLGNAELRPPATEEEARQASLRPYCAEGVVRGGEVEIVAQVREDCPQGMRVAAYVFPVGAVTGASVQLAPEMEWRLSSGVEEALREVVATIPSPPSAADGTNVSPPNTGDAQLAEVLDPADNLHVEALLGASAILSGALTAVLALRRRAATVWPPTKETH